MAISLKKVYLEKMNSVVKFWRFYKKIKQLLPDEDDNEGQFPLEREEMKCLLGVYRIE